MRNLDYNYAALIALILNENLTRDEVLLKMGLIKNIKVCEKIKSIELSNIKYLYGVKYMKLDDIGKIYNTSGCTVGRFLKDHYVELRTRGNRAKAIL